MSDWLFYINGESSCHSSQGWKIKRQSSSVHLLTLKRHRKHTIHIESVTAMKLKFHSWTWERRPLGELHLLVNITRRGRTSWRHRFLGIKSSWMWLKSQDSERIILWFHSRGKPYQTQSPPVVILEAICWCSIIFSHLKPLPCIKPLSCPAIYIWNDCSHSRAVSSSINSIPPVSSISRSFHLSLSLAPLPLFSLPINSS